MKKMKKLFAVLLTLAMVLGMSMTTFAAPEKNTAVITVSGADSATLEYAQVIQPDRTTETGWAFVNDNVARAYMNAFGVSSAQDAIKAMIPATSVDASKLAVAQANAVGSVTLSAMSNPQTVSSAGVYLVMATETGYTYNIMSAYVGFGEVTIDGITYEYPALLDTPLAAKKTPINVDKIVDDTDNVVKTGDVLTYTVKTHVPYIKPTDTDKTFFVYDELTGAKYTNKNETTITLAGTSQNAYTVVYNDTDTAFSVDLSDMINAANSNAGKELVITYKVVVTSENDIITNKATAGHKGGSQYGSKEIKTYEGNVTLTKTNEDGSKKLADAGFEVRKDAETDALKFVKLADGVYKYDPSGTETMVVTKADGTVKVQGLDVGTYTFKEVQAPEGYSVNGTDVTATLDVTEESGVAAAVLTATTSMADTKLSALPGTGGIGTTIFTIGGCLIMIAAAGLFFASRRKTK